MLTDPKDFMPKVIAPMLAVFGEDNALVPAQKSAERLENDLRQAGHQNDKIVVFPSTGHGLNGAMSD